ncbi:MAG TPA: hypothetical protein VIV60_37475 [Polyangiaceae bacterium]
MSKSSMSYSKSTAMMSYEKRSVAFNVSSRQIPKIRIRNLIHA